MLKLKKNLYGQKQAARVWNEHLKTGLFKIGFTPSKIDECLFYRDNVIFMNYVDDGIFCSPNNEAIDAVIQELRGLKFDIEDKGSIGDYLGINFEYNEDGSIKLSQPHLIEDILKQTHIAERHLAKTTPAMSSKILHRHEQEESFNNRFHYRSVVGKLNYLDKGTRPDISYAAHQCARHSQDPKKSHGEAILHHAKYLKGTKDKGLILKPNPNRSIEVHVDADFLWKLQSKYIIRRYFYSKVKNWLCYIICRMSSDLGFKTSNANCFEHN